MVVFLIWLLVKVVVFGVAITFATRKFKDVKVDPKSAIPLVALVFAGLNTLLYWLLAPAISLVSLWTLWFLAPFIANAILLYATDRLVKQFKIEGIVAFVKLSGVLTLAHLALRVVDWFV